MIIHAKVDINISLMERNLNSDKAKRKKREENRFLSAMGTKTHAYHYKIINSIALQEPNHIDTIKAFHHFLSIVTEALFQWVTGIQWIWELPNKDTRDWHLCHQSNLMNMQIIIDGVLKCKNGYFQYTLTIHSWPWSKSKRIERFELISLNWIRREHWSARYNLAEKMTHNKELLLHIVGWIYLLVF